MIGGFIQTGIHSSMDGLNGLAGWRWLFIIDGIITLPVAVYGYLLFPDTPRNTKAPYLSAEEKALAMSRVPEVSERTPISLTFLKHCFSTWYWVSLSKLTCHNSLILLVFLYSPLDHRG
jgi:MFS transporter, ACS family, pantothenate transporter